MKTVRDQELTDVKADIEGPVPKLRKDMEKDKVYKPDYDPEAPPKLYDHFIYGVKKVDDPKIIA